MSGLFGPGLLQPNTAFGPLVSAPTHTSSSAASGASAPTSTSESSSSRSSQQDDADKEKIEKEIEKEIGKITRFMDNDIQIPEEIKKNTNYTSLIQNIAKLKVLLN